MCPKPDARKKKKKKKTRKHSFQKEKKEKNKSGIVYIVYVEVAQSWLQLVVIPCLTLCLVASLNSKSCASTKF